MTAPYDQGPVGSGGRLNGCMFGALADDNNAVGTLRLNQYLQPVPHWRQDFLEKHAIASLRDLISKVAEHADEERVTERLASLVAQGNHDAQGLCGRLLRLLAFGFTT